MENMTAARESSEGRRDVHGRTRECVGEWEICCQEGKESPGQSGELGILSRGKRVVQSSVGKKDSQGRATAEQACWDISPMYPDPIRAQGLLERDGVMVSGSPVQLFLV